MNRFILFTGLVREPEKAIETIEAAAPFIERCGATVLFSTWVGELDRYPELVEALRRHRVQVIAQEQVGPRHKGNLLHQLLTLDAGLAQCDADGLVLKTRWDLGSLQDIEAFAAYEPRKPARGPGDGYQLTRRIAIRGFFPSQPLFINDIVFAGITRDLRQLARLSLASIANYSGRISTEQLIWSGAFVGGAPEIDCFLRVTPGLLFGAGDMRDRLYEQIGSDQLYVHALATSLDIIDRYLDWLLPQPVDEAPFACLSEHTLEDLLWRNVPVMGLRLFADCGANFVSLAPIAHALANGGYASSPLGDRVRAIIADRRAGHGHMSTSELRNATEDFGALIESCYPGSARYFPSQSEQFQSLTGQLPEWLAQQGSLDTINRLEADLAGLRRAHQALVQQLSEQAAATG